MHILHAMLATQHGRTKMLTQRVYLVRADAWHLSRWGNWPAGLAEAALRVSIEKDQTLRTGNWEAWPLTAEQQQYASLDAYASLLLYQAS